MPSSSRASSESQAGAANVTGPLSADQKDALASLRLLIEEVWRAHRNPDEPDYSGCETSECMWCDETRKCLAVLEGVTGVL